MDILIAPLSFFAFNPAAVFAVAALFAFPAFFPRFADRRRRTLLSVAAVWVGFGVWEGLMARGRAAGQAPAVRIDHFMIAPLLVGSALIGVAVIAQGLAKKPIDS